MWCRTGSVNDDGLIGQAEKAIPGHDGMTLAMPRIGSN
jgi:cellobiose transport system substrate-binding protein